MDCPYIPHTSYSDFSLRLHKKVVGQRIPITGSLELTARCNLRCSHCYINLPAGDQKARAEELSTTDIYHFLDQVVDEGCLWLLLTGGEPLLRPDFIDIYTYAKKKGLLLSIFTNGTTLTPRIIDYLADWRPFSIEITLYGYTQETYERVTGVPGSHARCLQGIEMLLEHKLPLKLKSMVMTINQHEIWDMKSYSESLGVEFRFDPIINARIDGDRRPEQYRISPEEVIALDLADEKRLEGLRKFRETYTGPPPRPDYLYQCGAGISSFHVDSYGLLSTCMITRTHSYDLRQGSFRDGWLDFLPRVRQQKWIHQTACQTCELIAMCGQCPGWSTQEAADQLTPVDYLCEISHLRAEVLDLQGETP